VPFTAATGFGKRLSRRPKRDIPPLPNQQGNLNKKILTAVVLAAGFALGFSPSVSSQTSGCTIVCERCTIDYKNGTAECTNCTVTGCTPQQPQ